MSRKFCEKKESLSLIALDKQLGIVEKISVGGISFLEGVRNTGS